jgi:hypothetical protein
MSKPMQFTVDDLWRIDLYINDVFSDREIAERIKMRRPDLDEAAILKSVQERRAGIKSGAVTSTFKEEEVAQDVITG